MLSYVAIVKDCLCFNENRVAARRSGFVVLQINEA